MLRVLVKRMINTNPIVTIGIPMYNAENTIELCLKSIIESDYDLDKLEIIIIDNFSTDNSIKVAESLLSSTNVNYAILQYKGSLGLLRQIILDKARGKYIIWIDADAIVSKNFIKKQLKFAENLKDVKLGAVLPIILSYNTESILARGIGYKWAISTVRALLRSRTPFLGMLGALTPRETMKKVGGFNIKLMSGEDTDLFYRMKRLGYKIFINPEARIYHIMPTKLRRIVTRTYRLSYYYRFYFPWDFHYMTRSIINVISATLCMLHCLKIIKDVACFTLPFISVIEEMTSIIATLHSLYHLKRCSSKFPMGTRAR